MPGTTSREGVVVDATNEYMTMALPQSDGAAPRRMNNAYADMEERLWEQ
jgi:hypothetical protein